MPRRPSPSAASVDEPEHDQKQDSADRRGDDGGDDAGAEVDAQPWQQPAADQGADDPDADVRDEAEAGAAHDVAGKPPGNKTDKQNDEKTFTRHDILSRLKRGAHVQRERSEHCGRGCRSSLDAPQGVRARPLPNPPPQAGEGAHRARGAAVASRTKTQSFSMWPQRLSLSAPLRSVTRPSRSWNLLGIWNMASISPPSGVQATWRLPGSRQTNSPGLTSSPAAGPSLSTSLPSST